MGSLDYSADAMTAKSFFYEGRPIIYVEGESDIPFWEDKIKQIGFRAVVQDVGSCTQFAKYIDMIQKRQANIIVAMDSDYSQFNSKKHNNKQIIVTPCYGIENLIYCRNKINHILHVFLKDKYCDNTSAIDDWRNHLSKDMHDILCYDIANDIFKKGIEVMGNSAHKFLDSKNKSKLSQNMIAKSILEASSIISEDEFSAAKKLMGNQDFFLIARCHFIESGAQAFIRQTVMSLRKTRIDNDAIDSIAHSCLPKCRPACSHMKKLKNKIRTAFRAWEKQNTTA